jgi:crotonobetainyl-CoA:carnitine CoA-transferase CaiB-like acyl-CoA transferase
MKKTDLSRTILGGCRVLEAGDGKISLCGKLLASMGAEVLRIEKPGTAKTLDYFQTGKKRLSLDMDTTAGQEIFKRIIPSADILIETFLEEDLQKSGLGYEVLKKTNSRLIVVSITPFGQNGPRHRERSSELVVSAAGGQAYVNGGKSDSPLKLFGDQAYYAASLFAANGVLLALLRRNEIGEGQYIDISVQECVAGTLDHVLVRYLCGGEIARREGSLYWNRAFRIFDCQDGLILLTILYQWDTLVELLKAEGMESGLDDEKWRSRQYCLDNMDYIIYVLEQWTAMHRVGELVEVGQLMRFPWAPVNSVSELADNPQLNDRGFFLEERAPGSGRKIKYPGAPCRMSASPWRTDFRLRKAGGANRRVYHDELGIPSEEMERLHKERII